MKIAVDKDLLDRGGLFMATAKGRALHLQQG